MGPIPSLPTSSGLKRIMVCIHAHTFAASLQVLPNQQYLFIIHSFVVALAAHLQFSVILAVSLGEQDLVEPASINLQQSGANRACHGVVREVRGKRVTWVSRYP